MLRPCASFASLFSVPEADALAMQWPGLWLLQVRVPQPGRLARLETASSLQFGSTLGSGRLNCLLATQGVLGQERPKCAELGY